MEIAVLTLSVLIALFQQTGTAESRVNSRESVRLTKETLRQEVALAGESSVTREGSAHSEERNTRKSGGNNKSEPSREGPGENPNEANGRVAAAAANPQTVTSEEIERQKGILKVKNQVVDLSVPESPAFTVLGLTPQTVVRPESPRAFATSLLNGVDRNGNFQTGVAVDTIPYLLFVGSRVTIQEYQRSIMTRLLSRTQFSFATTKGASEDDKSARLATGVRTTLFDKGDPRNDDKLTECFVRSFKKAGFFVPKNDQGQPDLSLSAEEIERQRLEFESTVIKPLAELCRQESAERNWNRTGWVAAAAGSWISPTGESKEFQWNGFGGWTSLAYGFEGVPALENTSQLILHARFRTNEMVEDPTMEGQLIRQDSRLVGVRFLAGTPGFTASGEFVFIRNMPEQRLADNSYTLSFGAERKVAANLWFKISFGGEGGRRNENGKIFVLTSFRWGFSQDPDLEESQRTP